LGFYDPEIPNALKDVSAATVVASALIEIAFFTNKNLYSDYSKACVENV